MAEEDEFDILRKSPVPAPRAEAKARALEAARQSFVLEKNQAPAQGTQPGLRLTERATKLWSEIMQKKLIATPAIAGLVALPIAGYATFYLLEESPFAVAPEKRISETDAPAEKPTDLLAKKKTDADSQPRQDTSSRDVTTLPAEPESAPKAEAPVATAEARQEIGAAGGAAAVAPAPMDAARGRAFLPSVANKQMADQVTAPLPAPADPMQVDEENRDRIEDFKTNPVKLALEDPVSTFSIDVDTASYSFVRRSLKEGFLPQADTVRVEEMINYFPYDWKGPDDAATPFNSTVTVMPTPWNDNTKLMHVAIKGYDVKPAEKPKANLVFLLDVSGSMDEPDKLPLLKSAFRLLVSKLGPDDTVSIVTYAGNAGTVLEPTKASEREKILNAVDTLSPGGSTAGEAGIREAYRLAEKSFVKDGVNRVMLATDGDFNVGQSDDDDLKRIIEEKRKSGVFLSVFGFGRGNLNDQMMQTIAQNGNGTAAYIDTLAEAEKVLVQDASSTLFPIAKDVKIQVEFNPQKVSEYRLIGYETRALNREDFNNDRVDAGEIGSGHSVTAIYEITPKGSPATVIDDLRYGQAKTDNPSGIANADEYAFVKIRYKAPDGDVSKLITTPVTSANEVGSFDAASNDQRFSVAVAAFGQKLRGTDQVAAINYDRIAEIATAARGTDPFGYRAEFLSLLRLASALDGSNR
ncbi:vWA domain-containing protein [Mesorhizobium sp. ZC-5]|uniref:vWA domain-containing protein n=1 Tax=Mesorhizobium sp. ZC-5 TaxID=2986066 RepID=UPI0021E738AD|nr:VWA domain-containing protein [Mesorhizobium sp. ZC-5]MCV3240900.1 VWA domain-containing protein [Mesorhizobium sp. ZC-5]